MKLAVGLTDPQRAHCGSRDKEQHADDVLNRAKPVQMGRSALTCASSGKCRIW